MKNNWDDDDEDLGSQGFDDLDPIPADRQRSSSKTLETSEGAAEPGSFPRNPHPANPRASQSEHVHGIENGCDSTFVDRVQGASDDEDGCDSTFVDRAQNPYDDGPSEWDYTLAKEIPPPISGLGYKIPGPAGAVQNLLPSNGVRTQVLGLIEKFYGPSWVATKPAVAAETVDFKAGPWLAAMEYLNEGDDSSRTTIESIKGSYGRIHQFAAVVDKVKKNSLGDLFITLKDPSGEIRGSIHRNVLTALDNRLLITPGAAIILRNVPVFSFQYKKRALNIHTKNVHQIFGKETIAPRRRRREVSDRNVSEILDNDEVIRADSPSDISPGLGERSREDLPLPTTLEDVVDSRVLGGDSRVLGGESRVLGGESRVLGGDSRVPGGNPIILGLGSTMPGGGKRARGEPRSTKDFLQRFKRPAGVEHTGHLQDPTGLS